MSAPKIHIQVISAGPLLPSWARAMLDNVLAIEGTHWTGWTQVAGASPGTGMGEGLYQKFDHRLMARGNSIDTLAAPANAPRSVAAGWKTDRTALEVPAQTINTWAAADISLVIWLLPAPPRFTAPVPAGLKVWALALGDAMAAHPFAGSRAMLDAPHLCEVCLYDFASTPPHLLYRSVSAAVTNSLAATRQRALNKGQAFMARCIGVQQAKRTLTPPALSDVATGWRDSVSALPTGLSLLAGVVRRVVLNRLERHRYLDQWQLAFTFDANLAWDALEHFHFIEPPREVFWADPMPLFWQDRHWIIFEELPFAAPCGRLLAIEVHPDGSYGEPLPVMETPHHLSYPFMIKEQDQLLMVPETSATRQVELHRCVGFPGQWELDTVLLSGVNAVDATLWQAPDGHWWMWVSVVEEGAERGEELHIYHAEQLRGPWQAHLENPVVSDIRCARPAGPIMCDTVGLLRPAQDSAAAYGHHIEWRRITTLTPEHYAEQSAGQLAPPPKRAWLRIHTVGVADGLRVLDVMVRRPRKK